MVLRATDRRLHLRVHPPPLRGAGPRERPRPGWPLAGRSHPALAHRPPPPRRGAALVRRNREDRDRTGPRPARGLPRDPRDPVRGGRLAGGEPKAHSARRLSPGRPAYPLPRPEAAGLQPAPRGSHGGSGAPGRRVRPGRPPQRLGRHEADVPESEHVLGHLLELVVRLVLRLLLRVPLRGRRWWRWWRARWVG